MTVPAHPPEENKTEPFHVPFSANLFANHDKSDVWSNSCKEQH